MKLHEEYGLTRLINAAGAYTPLGVSRSSAGVRAAVDAALGEYLIIDELQRAVSQAINAQTGAPAACVTHCVAAAITLAIAAAITGSDEAHIGRLPDTTGLANRVVIPAGHVVDYGHSLLSAIRLAGAEPVVVGDETSCDIADIEHALMHERTACLLLVSSRLIRGPRVDLDAAVACAHRLKLPALIDGAAQDMRIEALLATGADLVLISAHKYMASPTAGLMIGASDLVAACRAQERGIGRAMKATKESLVGVLAALEERAAMNVDRWRELQARKSADFCARLGSMPGVTAAAEQPDPSGMPFSRACLSLASPQAARTLVTLLENGSPSIRVMQHALPQATLIFELVPLTDDELETIVARLHAALVEMNEADQT